MAYAFPLTAAQFWEKLAIETLQLDIGEALKSARTAGGEIGEAELGARLWQGRVTIGKLLYTEEAEARAILDRLRGGGGSFLAWDTRHPGPRLDPAGVILGGATPTIQSIAGNRLDLTLQALPAGYVLSPGDRLGFGYGSSPVRQALHKLVQGGTASGGGVLTVEVTPAIREGATAGAAVTLIRPLFKAKYVPGSWDPGTSRRGLSEGASFGLIQTLGSP